MKKLFLFIAALALISCADNSKKEVSPSWAGKMQKTAQSFQELLPYLYNEEKFSAKENSKIVEAKIQNYAKNIHKITGPQAKALLGDDPYIQESIGSLSELTDRSLASFRRGDRKNSRILLKATTHTCFKCHTRQNVGPQSVYWKNFDVDSLQTSSIEKANILVSMRQYELAKLHLKEYLSELEAKGKFNISYENALHYYLMVSLRGQSHFKETLDFIRAKILVIKTPTELHYTLKHWQKDLNFLTKNKEKLKANPATAQKILARSKNKYGERNLVNNLVASSLLHQYLMSNPAAKEKAVTYSLLGQAYDQLILEGFWDLPEVYYEMCINFAPKSKIAKHCFRKLKDNVTIGYSGSRGSMVPSQEYERLEMFRKKAGL